MIQKGVLGSGRSLVKVVIVVLITALLTTAGNILYTREEISAVRNEISMETQKAIDVSVKTAIDDSNRKWCNIVSLFDTTYRSQPPTTPAGQQLAIYFKELRENFKC